MNFTDNGLVEVVCLLTLTLLLLDVDSRLCFHNPRFGNLCLKEIVIFVEFPFPEGVVSDELLLHVDVVHDV